MKDPAGESRRWWAQALEDLAFGEWIKREGRFFDKGCFIAQQAAEKALKACCYPNGLPGGVPASFFVQDDLSQALEDAKAVIDAVGTWLTGKGVLTKGP